MVEARNGLKMNMISSVWAGEYWGGWDERRTRYDMQAAIMSLFHCGHCPDPG
jgi:predicted metal-binding protein